MHKDKLKTKQDIIVKNDLPKYGWKIRDNLHIGYFFKIYRNMCRLQKISIKLCEGHENFEDMTFWYCQAHNLYKRG